MMQDKTFSRKKNTTTTTTTKVCILANNKRRVCYPNKDDMEHISLGPKNII